MLGNTNNVSETYAVQRNWQHRVHKTQVENKHYRKPKGQFKMDNPEELGT